MTREDPFIGKFILDTLSIGMYNDPLMIFREYVQNSVDSIDDIKMQNFTPKIEIEIDGFSRKIIIRDNGKGIKQANVESTLLNLGKSLKKKEEHRGFRGIGRLGGLGYCKQLRFITKAKGENKYSVISWNCDKLKQILKNNNDYSNAQTVIKTITNHSVVEYDGDRNKHYFIVELIDVQSPYDILLDVPRVKLYIAQVCPVPFDREKFIYATKIENEIRQKVPLYKVYDIMVNREKIYKLYKDNFKVAGKKVDYLTDYNSEFIRNGKGPLAYIWIAKTRLLGAIQDKEGIGGLRARSGNILVGDNNLLSKYFRENRFNKYLIGELHIIEPGLVLNSRRDDFEDNEYKEEFYTEFARNIGLPYSRYIRESSEKRRKGSGFNKHSNLVENTNDIIKKGYIATLQKKKMLKELNMIKNSKIKNNMEEISDLIGKLKKSKHFLDKDKQKNKVKDMKLVKDLCDIVYKNSSAPEEAKKIIIAISKRVLNG